MWCERYAPRENWMQTLQNVLLVGLGGFIGSVLRYSVSGWSQRLFEGSSFPLGTATVNVIGCLIIGLLGGLAEHLPVIGPQTRLFLFIGLLGGFTTFSTFGYETMSLVRDNQLPMAFANVGAQLVLGFGAVVLGFNCSRLFSG